MNLFIAGHGTAGVDVAVARRALSELISELGFFDPAHIETWRAPTGKVAIAACANTELDHGSVRYTVFESDRAALFAGRPVWWPEGAPADGESVLDPAFYLAPVGQWASKLDGRCTALRAADGTLELWTDPMGAYPVFTTHAGEVHWFSNNPDVLRRIAGDGSLDELALASVIGGGWSLGGHPLFRAVRRLDRGVVLTLDRDGGERRLELLPIAELTRMPGAGFDAATAARDLVDVTRALAGWPGRPDAVPVTGGRDSRLILAAALRAGFDFSAVTGGAPGEPDVEIARRLCGLAGLTHELLGPDPYGDRFSDLPRAAQVTALASGGTATLTDAAGFPLGPPGGPAPLWHSGQGGEIGRAYWGLFDSRTVERLYAKYVGRRPGRTEPISAEAGELIRTWISDFCEQMLVAGASPVDVPDMFYLLERTMCWASPTHTVVELIRDTTSPLWSVRLLSQLLGPAGEERVLDRFHRDVLRELAPEFVDVRFQDGSTWPVRRGRLVQKASQWGELAVKARGELTRRVAGRRARAPTGTPSGMAASDPFDAIIAAIRDAALSQPQHAAWSVLDRRRVEGLLGAPAVALDEMSRYYIWRLGSVFLGFR